MLSSIGGPVEHRRAARLTGCAAIAFAALLSGCGAPTSADDRHLLARGKDFEVTGPELDQLLRRAPRVERADQVAPLRRAMLERLVDEKLLAEAAVDDKLDRQVETMQAIEAARRATLARAYVDKIASKAAQPTPAEIEAALKAQGPGGPVRALTIDEITAPANAPAMEAFRLAFDRGGFDALTARLAAAGLPAGRGRTRLRSEDLPGLTPDRLAALAVGGQVVFRVGDVAHFGRIAAIERAALAPQAARAEIAGRMAAQRRAAVLQSELARLRADRAIVVNDPSHQAAAPAP
jgi:EpsD family peptidyl-prolyl cis-trans isomerase